MMQVLLGCNAPGCSAEARIPVLIGAPLPVVETACRVCSGGIMVVKSHDGANDQATKGAVAASAVAIQPPASQAPMTFAEGGPDFLGGFINRLSPVYLAVESVMLNRLPGDSVSLAKVISPFLEWSSEIRDNLRRIEENLGIGRGQRLSDGFPSSNPEKLGPRNIALRNLFGTDGEKITAGSGLLQKIGVLKVSKNIPNTFIVGEPGARLIGVLDEPVNMHLRSKGLAPIGIYGTHPQLPVFFTADNATGMLKAVFEVMPDEEAWAMHILRTIRDHAGENGWDSNVYASSMAALLLDGAGDQGRWRKSSGLSLAEHYIDLGKRKKEKSPRDFAKERLTNNINSALGGLFGRLKELGLIYPIADGPRKNVALTDVGASFIEEYEEVIQ